MYRVITRRFSGSRQNVKELIESIAKNNCRVTHVNIYHLSLPEFMALNNAIENNTYVIALACPPLNDYNYFGRAHYGTVNIIANDIEKVIVRNKGNMEEKIDLPTFLKESNYDKPN